MRDSTGLFSSVGTVSLELLFRTFLCYDSCTGCLPQSSRKTAPVTSIEPNIPRTRSTVRSEQKSKVYIYIPLAVKVVSLLLPIQMNIDPRCNIGKYLAGIASRPCDVGVGN